MKYYAPHNSCNVWNDNLNYCKIWHAELILLKTKNLHDLWYNSLPAQTMLNSSQHSIQYWNLSTHFWKLYCLEQPISKDLHLEWVWKDAGPWQIHFHKLIVTQIQHHVLLNPCNDYLSPFLFQKFSLSNNQKLLSPQCLDFSYSSTQLFRLES